MCDTIIALPSETSDKKVCFTNNSDRELNEAQYIEWSSHNIRAGI